jgi:hypothetical protein
MSGWVPAVEVANQVNVLGGGGDTDEVDRLDRSFGGKAFGGREGMKELHVTRNLCSRSEAKSTSEQRSALDRGKDKLFTELHHTTPQVFRTTAASSRNTSAPLAALSANS